MNRSAKNPITTLGTVARVSRIGFRKRRGRGPAYSDRYSAAPRPRGAATTIAMSETISVPATIVFTSKRFRRGNHPVVHSAPRSTLLRKSIAPPANETTIATLMTTERNAAEKNSPRMERSRRCRAVAPCRSPIVSRLGRSAAICAIVLLRYFVCFLPVRTRPGEGPVEDRPFPARLSMKIPRSRRRRSPKRPELPRSDQRATRCTAPLRPTRDPRP